MLAARTLKHEVTIGITVLSLATAACASGPPGPPPPGLGTVENRPVPAALADLPLTDQRGAQVTLASWRGKTVMVVPFLSLCTDICPLDTGNLLQMENVLRRDHVASEVQVVEMSVDPQRDTPARLAAYTHLTGASWELVTESPGALSEFERYFGWVVQRVPEDNPPSIDWWTHQALTYDLNHSDGFILIDGHGTQRFSTGAAPDFHGTLNLTLHRFLPDEGLRHLAHPQRPDWNPASALAALGWVLGRPLPATN